MSAFNGFQKVWCFKRMATCTHSHTHTHTQVRRSTVLSKCLKTVHVIRLYWNLQRAVWTFLCVRWRAPQQKLRTHRSLKTYCATLWWRWRETWSVFFSFFQVMEHPVEWNWQGKTEGKTCPSVTLSTTNPTWTGVWTLRKRSDSERIRKRHICFSRHT
jgi:hypothetical protein